MISSSFDGTLRLWDVFEENENQACIRVFEGGSSGIRSISFSRDGCLVAAAHYLDKTVRIWETRTGRCLRTFEGHDSAVYTAAFDGTDERVLSGDKNGIVRIWHYHKDNKYLAPYMLCQKSPAASEVMLRHAETYFAEVQEAEDAFEQGRFVEAASLVKSARQVKGFHRSPEGLELWQRLYLHLPRNTLRGIWCSQVFPRTLTMATSLACSPDGKNLISGHSGYTPEKCVLRLWDIATGQIEGTFTGHTRRVNAVLYSHDGRFAFSAGMDGNIFKWDMATRQYRPILQLTGHEGQVYDISLSSNGRFLASAGADGDAMLWDTEAGRFLRRYPHPAPVLSVVFSPGKALLSTMCEDLKARCFMAATGDEIFCKTAFPITEGENQGGETPTSALRPTRVCYSPDTHREIWLCDTFAKMYTENPERGFDDVVYFPPPPWNLQNHEAMNSVEFSPDARFMVTTSDNGTIQVWNVFGESLATGLGHTERVESAVFSMDSRYVLSAGSDCTIRKWFMDWDLAEKQTTDWDNGAFPFLYKFLMARSTSKALPLHRLPKDREIKKAFDIKKCAWTETDFERLLTTLKMHGYGWLQPDGVRRILHALTGRLKRRGDVGHWGHEEISKLYR